MRQEIDQATGNGVVAVVDRNLTGEPQRLLEDP
jgi:hypothetical protein